MSISSFQQNFKGRSAPLPAAQRTPEDIFNEKLSNEILGFKDASSLQSSIATSEVDDETTTIVTTTSGGNENPTTFRRVKKFAARKGKAFIRNFVDYGPPYDYDNVNPSLLVDECARPALRLTELHTLLNAKLDPNLPDPEDLYYTPMHWVARNAHYLGMRMLRRAGAELNVTDEMGITPLDLCVMMRHPPNNRRNNQLKMARYFLENDADVNTRDKAGYGPIDYAAMNQDLELITLLLDYGATVRRENYILSAKRSNILQFVHDPKCYKILYEKLIEEDGEFELRQSEIAQKDEMAKEAQYYIDNRLSLSKKRQKRLERQKAELEVQAAEDVEKLHREKLEEEMEANLKAQESKAAAREGVWERDEVDGHWEYSTRVPEVNRLEKLYEESKQLMDSLRTQNSPEPFNKKWGELTGGSSIEFPWRRADPFKDRPQQRQQGYKGVGTAAGRSGGGSDGEHGVGSGDDKAEILSKKTLVTGADGKVVDLDFRDENDAELEGEDLDELLADIDMIR